MESRKEIKDVQQNLSIVTKETMESRKEIKDIWQNLFPQNKEMMESRKEIIESRKQMKDVQENLSTVTKEMMESRKEIKDVRQNLLAVTKEMEEMKAMIIELVQTLPSPTEELMNSDKNDILIAGGCYSSGHLKSVEKFSWKEKKWSRIATMKIEHTEASSFIHDGNLFVVGGSSCKSIETLNLNQSPLTWQTFPGELSYELFGHQTVVYKSQILHIGGCIGDKGKSDLISEIHVTGTSLILKEFCHMPEPRYGHGAAIVDDKVFIFGGQGRDGKVLSSVLEFDPRTLTFKEMPPLPHPLVGMATVQWRDQVVLLGGRNDNADILNDVIMYDSKVGEIKVLPSMLINRVGCCAVLTGDTIVVMGGVKNQYLKSVEFFEMESSFWKKLPSMNEARKEAIAEVLPITPKCNISMEKRKKSWKETKNVKKSCSTDIKTLGSG
ncbi:beta-scruin-like [Xenia sp. Carnegie-2017]|uniref:beta-scruin-like n=1 Tax=Xenia sp. Carnegie-2017 TaxID=2897299 RepID=UPI001F037B0F|nr:beta-scruin-like [Xenia sp. Carnegie-2017]